MEGKVWLDRCNLFGDGQADLKNHGGHEKAVLAYSVDHYPDWRIELNHRELPYGAFGENFTIEGLAEKSVCIGDTYVAGDVRLQVSQPRQPCWKISRRWQIKDLAEEYNPQGVLDGIFGYSRKALLSEGFIWYSLNDHFLSGLLPVQMKLCNIVIKIDM